MPYMIFFVLDDPNKLEELLQSWDAAGVRGATIVESSGIHRQLQRIIPMRYSFSQSGGIEESHLTLLVIVPSMKGVRACLAASERVVGNLEHSRTGIFAAWPVSLVKGLPADPELPE